MLMSLPSQYRHIRWPVELCGLHKNCRYLWPRNGSCLDDNENT